MLEAGRERERWLVEAVQSLITHLNARHAVEDEGIPMPVIPFNLAQCEFEPDVFPDEEEDD